MPLAGIVIFDAVRLKPLLRTHGSNANVLKAREIGNAEQLVHALERDLYTWLATSLARSSGKTTYAFGLRYEERIAAHALDRSVEPYEKSKVEHADPHKESSPDERPLSTESVC